jgi:PPM family protein phosphatase
MRFTQSYGIVDARANDDSREDIHGRATAVIAPTTRVPLSTGPIPKSEGAGLTHRGRVRLRNEDAILTDPAGLLWAVSDGMGGHGHGDLASEIVIECLAGISDLEARETPKECLVGQLERANALVREQAVRLGSPAMGATVVAVIVSRAVANFAWAGDSRAYLFRRGALRLLTHDHTVVQGLMDRGELAPNEAEMHPESHVVTRAIGGADTIEVDTVQVPLFEGDWLLLCSDGLTGCLYDHRLAEILEDAGEPEEACRKLLSEALEAGAPDNVSVVAIQMRAG